MTFDSNLTIKKIIVHILDSSVQIPVLSDVEHPLNDEVNEFIGNHIIKVLEDDGLKNASFEGEDNKIKYICRKMGEQQESFVQLTCEMAAGFYDLMQKNPDIPSGDLIFCLFSIDGKPHLGVLKLNYRESYVHFVGSNHSGRVNTIIKQKATLPAVNQKIDECAIIGLEDGLIRLLEKKYDINGEKEYYFSSMFLGCTTQMSDKEKVRIFKKATQSFNKKYCGEDITKTADFKQAVAESIEQNSTIDIVNVAENVFRRNPGLKDEYINHMEKAGLKERSIEVSEKMSERAFKKHKIKTDNGIELNLPVDYYNDRDKIEFFTNPDGTISIIIKNITRITDV